MDIQIKQVIIVVVALITVSCQNTIPLKPQIVIENESITGGYQEATFTIGYVIKNGDRDKLIASSSEDWIRNIVVENDNVLFSVGENNSGGDRYGELRLDYPGAESVVIKVEQEWSAPKIKLTPPMMAFDYAGGQGSFYYEVENPRKSVNITASGNVNWITDVDVAENTVSFYTQENNSRQDRSGKIILSYGQFGSAEFTINQQWVASVIKLSKSSEDFDYVGGSSSFNFQIENPRQGASVSVQSNCEWITDVTITDDTVSYSVSENNSGSIREGMVILKYGYYAAEAFTVRQRWSATTIILSPTGCNIGHDGGSQSFSYQIDNPRQGASVEAYSNCEWITDVKVNGSAVSFIVKENKSGAIREGSLTIQYGIYDSTSFVVKQDGAPVTDISLDQSSLTILVGNSVILHVFTSPADADVRWTSSNNSIATVNQQGLVTGISKGEVIITVMPLNGSLTATCKVIVDRVGGITEGMGETIWK